MSETSVGGLASSKLSGLKVPLAFFFFFRNLAFEDSKKVRPRSRSQKTLLSG